MTLERDIEANFRRWCQRRGYQCLKLVDAPGWTDRIILPGQGVAGFVELKKPGGKVSTLQRSVNHWLRDHGYPALITDNLIEAQSFIEELVT